MKIESDTPEVGPFFLIKTKSKINILNDTVPIKDAENYGDYSISGSDHYSYWHKLQKCYPKLKDYDYDYFPRGRVVYSKKDNMYYLYLDKCIQDEDSIEAITNKLKIPMNSLVIKSDEHYQCHSCNKEYVNIVEE